jgi:hypothetical protein
VPREIKDEIVDALMEGFEAV